MSKNIVLNQSKKIIKLTLSRAYYSFHQRDKNLWVFGEWFGECVKDNCLYFANWLAANHPELQLIWITKKGTDTSLLDRKIHICEMSSSEAVYFLKNAGAVFVVQTFSDIIENNWCFYGNALVVNLGHGVPWKKLFNSNLSNFHRFLGKLVLSAAGVKRYLSTSDLFTDYWISTVYAKKANILEAGYPRNSPLYDKEFCKEAKEKLVEYLTARGITINALTKVITYMPTFRDKTNDVFSFEDIIGNELLANTLKQYNAVIIQKSHFISARRRLFTDYGNVNLILLNEYPSQELLAATDILITDYSSCLYDFLILDRPIIHFLYDYDYYANEDRGLYYPKEDVCCGDIVENTSELFDAIQTNLSQPNRNHYLRSLRRQQYLQFESPDSCAKIYDAIIKILK